MKKITFKAIKYVGKQVENDIYVLDMNILNQERLNKDILYYIPDARVFIAAPVEADLLSKFNKSNDTARFTADITERVVDGNITIEMIKFTKAHQNNIYLYRLKGSNIWFPLSKDLYIYNHTKGVI